MTTELETTIKADFESAGGIKALAADILYLSADVNADDHSEPGVDEPFIDCRLRYHNGMFSFLTGSSDYDQDHRGHWGCSSVGMDCTDDESRSIADDLLDQVIDDAYQSA